MWHVQQHRACPYQRLLRGALQKSMPGAAAPVLAWQRKYCVQLHLSTLMHAVVSEVTNASLDSSGSCKALPGTFQAGRENDAVPGGLLDSSTGGVPSSRVPERLKLPF